MLRDGAPIEGQGGANTIDAIDMGKAAKLAMDTFGEPEGSEEDFSDLDQRTRLAYEFDKMLNKDVHSASGEVLLPEVTKGEIDSLIKELGTALEGHQNEEVAMIRQTLSNLLEALINTIDLHFTSDKGKYREILDTFDISDGGYPTNGVGSLSSVSTRTLDDITVRKSAIDKAYPKKQSSEHVVEAESDDAERLRELATLAKDALLTLKPELKVKEENEEASE